MAFSTQDRDALVGREIGGCKVVAPIGGGATSYVFAAKHLALGKKVALKILDPQIARNAEAKAAFFEEAQIAASIEHANVIPIFNVGEEGEIAFITMRYLEGASLYRVLSRQGIDQVLAIRISEQIASALGVVHENGYVHRDVKPENLLITSRGQAFLTDFGVASPIGKAEPAGRGGSPAYMSPEQCRGDELDGRSDFYSLGVTLYQMLSGRRPFLGETSASLMLMHQQDDFPPLKSLVPDIAPDLARLVEAMLAKDPKERPDNANAIIQVLQDAQEELRAMRRRSEGMKIRKKKGSLPSESGFHRLVRAGEESGDETQELVEDVELGLLLIDGQESSESQQLAALADGGKGAQASAVGAKSRFLKALRVIDAAIEKRPKDPNLHITRGNLFRQRGKLEEAEACYRRGYELAPKSARAMTALGACLRLAGRITEAESLLKSALELQPHSVEARISLGKIYENAGASSLARQQYIKITKESPNDERGFVALGVLLVNEEKYESAADALATARTLNPSFAPTLFWLAVIEAQRGALTNSIELLEKAVKAGLRDKLKLVERPELKALQEHSDFKNLLTALKISPDMAKE